MLRSIIKSRHLLTLPRRASSTVEPSTTTTLIVKSLSATATETSLKAALAGVVTNTRKVEMEPGCSIHVVNEAQASYITSTLASRFSYDCSVASTTLPSLLLQNLPSTVCSSRLEKAFGRFQPKLIRLVGSASIKVCAEQDCSMSATFHHFFVDICPLLLCFYNYHTQNIWYV